MDDTQKEINPMTALEVAGKLMIHEDFPVYMISLSNPVISYYPYLDRNIYLSNNSVADINPENRIFSAHQLGIFLGLLGKDWPVYMTTKDRPVRSMHIKGDKIFLSSCEGPDLGKGISGGFGNDR